MGRNRKITAGDKRRRAHAKRAAIEREAAQEYQQLQKQFTKELEEIEHGNSK